MRTLDIGIDIDGVGYDLLGAMSTTALAYGHEMATVENYRGWYKPEGWGMTQGDFRDFLNRAANAGELFNILPPEPGFREMMQALREAGHRTHVITARGLGCDGATSHGTREWFREYSIPFTTLTFSTDKALGRLDTFIEDNRWNYDALEEAGSNPYLLDRPWTRPEGGDERRRVSTLDEFVAVVDTLCEPKALVATRSSATQPLWPGQDALEATATFRA